MSQTFTLPEIPDNLKDDNEKKEYVAVHYWDNYDFNDPIVFVEGDFMHEYFHLLKDVSYTISDESIFRTLDKASINNQIFSLFIDTYRIYLMNPESYYCDYERYLAVPEFVIGNEVISQSRKSDFLLERDIICKNRIGDRANDFIVMDKNNNRLELWKIESDFLILFFNNPNCGICLETKDDLSDSEVINELIDSGKLAVLSVCPYDEYEKWIDTEYPSNWMNGFELDGRINKEHLYYFVNSSSLYLLDKDKKVLMKDIRLDLLELYLSNLLDY